MTRKEAYRESIGTYGVITLCYLINYYEELEDYRECKLILEVIEEFDKQFIGESTPKRYDEKAIKWWNKLIFDNYRVDVSNTQFDVELYAEKVRKYVGNSEKQSIKALN